MTGGLAVIALPAGRLVSMTDNLALLPVTLALLALVRALCLATKDKQSANSLISLSAGAAESPAASPTREM